jgi:hypothetical protein
VGEPFHIKVTLRQPISLNDVRVDLHWATGRREPRGFLVEAALTSEETATLDATVRIPSRADLGFVQVVVFVSPSGMWADHTLAATSEQIAVRHVSSAPASSVLNPLAVYDDTATDPAVPADSYVLNICITLLWLTSVVVLRRHSTEPGAAPLLVACLLAASWELLPIEGALSRSARSVMLEQGLYYQRQAFQVFASTVVIATVAGFVALTTGGNRVWRLAWIGFWIWTGITLIGLISLHAVDKVLAMNAAGLSASGVARLGAAVGTLVVLLRFEANRQRAG